MTAAEATRLAQSNPVPNLNDQWVNAVMEARASLATLAKALRHIDKLAGTLAEHDITVSVDLGPIGNAAAAARRDLEKPRNEPEFRMPTTPNIDR